MFSKIPVRDKRKTNPTDLDSLFEEISPVVKEQQDSLYYLSEADEPEEKSSLNIKTDTPFLEFWAAIGYIINQRDAAFMRDAISSENISEFIGENSESIDKIQRFVNAVPELNKNYKLSSKISDSSYYNDPAAMVTAFSIALGSFSSRTKRLVDLASPDKDMKSGSTFLTWDSIDDYYKKMLQFDQEKKVDSEKNNTADIIVSNNSDLLNFIDKNSDKIISYDAETGVLELDGTRWAQISLKKGMDDAARLGRVTTYITKKYGVGLGSKLISDLADKDSGEEEDVTEEIISEGVMNISQMAKDLFDTSVSTIKSLGETFMDIMKNIGDRISDAYKKMTGYLSSSLVGLAQKELSKESGIPKSDLDSILLSGGDISLEEDQQFNEKVGDMKSKGGKVDTIIKKLKPEQRRELVLILNRDLDSLLASAEKVERFKVSDMENEIDPEKAEADELPGDAYRKIITNILSCKLMKNLLVREEDNIEKQPDEIVKDFIELQKEAIMGQTSLPIIKVFGKDPNDITDDDDSEVFTQEKVSKITEDITNALSNGDWSVGGLYVNLNEVSGYYVMGFYGIAGVTDSGEPKYYYFQMTTFSSSTYSYKVEAQSLKSQEDFEKTFN